MSQYRVNNPNVSYLDDEIVSNYNYQSTIVDQVSKEISLYSKNIEIHTKSTVPKMGLMLVGLAGNNGTTVTAGILANKHKICWNTKEGVKHPNYYGSVTQASTVNVGFDSKTFDPVHIPFNSLLPMVHPNDIVIGGWDINNMNLFDAMQRAQVLDYDLQRNLKEHMEGIKPLPSIYYENFIASNQKDRANNLIPGNNKFEHLEQIRRDIQQFKAANQLDKVIVLWTANTERYSEILPGVHDTVDNLMASIRQSHSEVSASTIFAVASILEGCSFINGSPQNTFVPAVLDLATQRNVFVVGDDFKSGQTKMKSVLVDFLVSAGIKPVSIVSYNHLGNNDGKNLSAPEQFRSKEISKSNVVDDMVHSNHLLYDQGEHPDHVVVIKYVPYVRDSKRAMDEYTSEIFMHGKNTIVMHNTCEDSLLASPLIIDLAVLCEIAERISFRVLSEDSNNSNSSELERFDVVLSLLSYLMKAPLVPKNTPVVNALNAQRQCIVNIFRACVGMPPENYMTLEHKIPALMHASRGSSSNATNISASSRNNKRKAEVVDADHTSEESAPAKTTKGKGKGKGKK